MHTKTPPRELCGQPSKISGVCVLLGMLFAGCLGTHFGNHVQQVVRAFRDCVWCAHAHARNHDAKSEAKSTNATVVLLKKTPHVDFEFFHRAYDEKMTVDLYFLSFRSFFALRIRFLFRGQNICAGSRRAFRTCCACLDHIM
jgi:hypothetical protein